MGRPLRIDQAGDYHHVINRGRNQQDVFGDVLDRHAFLQLVRTAVDRGYVEVHSFVLMGNHYHMLLRSLIDGGTSATMQLLGYYTLEFNRKYGFDGSLFKGRFYSKRIDSEGYLMEIPRYIANNPVKAGLARKPADYLWSSHALLLAGEGAMDFPVSHRLIDEFFNGDLRELDRFVRAQDSPRAIQFGQVIDANLTEQSLANSLEFVGIGLARIDELRVKNRWCRDLQHTLTAFVCDSLKTNPVSLAFPDDTADKNARLLLVALLYHCQVADLTALASAFAFGTKQGVSRAIKRFEATATRDPLLGQLLQAGLSIGRLAA